MVLIAVPRWEVLRRLTDTNELYTLINVWPYNNFFTNTIDILPLADPDPVVACLNVRLDGLAVVTDWDWYALGRIEGLCMRVRITEHASSSIS